MIRVWKMDGTSYMSTPEAEVWAMQQPLCSCDGCRPFLCATWAKVSWASRAQIGMVSGSLAVLLIEGSWGRHLESSAAWTAVIVSSLVAQGVLMIGSGCIPSPSSSGNGECRHTAKVCVILLEGTLTTATVFSRMSHS